MLKKNTLTLGMRKNLPQYSDIALIAITVVHTGMSMD
jgi:hypothetical protein